MRGVNKAILLGNVGNDPEIRTTGSGTLVAKVSLATNREWRDRTGAKQEETDWHRLTFFGKLAEVVERYVQKGDRLYVEGRIEYSQTEYEGQTRYWTDVIVNELTLLGSAKPVEATEPPGNPVQHGGEVDSDIPF